MVSKINIAEFIERLSKKTQKYGNWKLKEPIFQSSMFGESNVFYGTYDTKIWLTKTQLYFQHHLLFLENLILKTIPQTK
jgi:hypothetical protein